MTPRDPNPRDELPSTVEQLLQVWKETEVELPSPPGGGQEPHSTRRLIAASAGDGDAAPPVRPPDGGGGEQRWEQWTTHLLQRIHAPTPELRDEEWPLLAPLPRAQNEPIWAAPADGSPNAAPGDELPDSMTFQELARAALAAQPDRPHPTRSLRPASNLVGKEPRSAPPLRPPPSSGAPTRIPSSRVRDAQPRAATVAHLSHKSRQQPEPTRVPPTDVSAANGRHAGFAKWWPVAAAAAGVLAVWLMQPFAAEPQGAVQPTPSAGPVAAQVESGAAPERPTPEPPPARERKPVLDPPREAPAFKAEAKQPPAPARAATPSAAPRPNARSAPRTAAPKPNAAAPSPLEAPVARQSRAAAPSDSTTQPRAAAESAAAAPRLVPAARVGADSNSSPTRPTIGAAQNAIGAVLGTARACVAGQAGPSRSTVVFDSTGAVREVHISGAAAGTSAEPCLKRALGQARVRPFTDPSFSVRTTVRP